MTKVLVPLADGFEETEAIATIDVLRRAGMEVTTAGVGKAQITGSHDITVKADAVFAFVRDQDWDAIVLPGGPGTKDLDKAPGLHERLKKQLDAGKLVAAICAAPTILENAGLIRGKTIACFPGVENRISSATIVHQNAVRDGHIITSRGMGTAIDFGLAIVEYFQGADDAHALAEKIVFAERFSH